MYIFALLLLLALNGTFASSDICRERASSVCNERPSFPETEAELERVCLTLQRTFECIRNYAASCGAKELDEMGVYSEVLTHVCRKGTRLHSNIAGNLPCLKDIFEHVAQQCQGFTRNAINHLYEQVMEAGNAQADDNHVYRVLDCLYVAVQAQCFVSQTTVKCGGRAKDAVLEIMTIARLLEDECPASVQREVLQLLNVLALATEEEVHVKRLLGGRK